MPTEMNTPDRLQRAILAAIESERQRIVEEEAERAAAQVRQRMRALVGSVALSTLLEYDVASDGRNLTIKVRNFVAVDQHSAPS